MRRVPRSRMLLAIAGLGAALALCGSALAAFPGTNGRIAFARSVGTGYDYDLYTMRADGTGRRAVVSSLLTELDPAYSANGRRIVFVRDVDRRLEGVNLEIFTKNLITGAIRRITRSPGPDWDPAWSPGGGRIVF